MNYRETANLYKQGKEHWNSWAMSILNSDDKSSEWKIRASVDFRSIPIGKEANDFSDFIFPDEVIFDSVVFYKKVTFKGAIFHGEAYFGGSIFKDSVNFEECQFNSNVWFSDHIKFKDRGNNFYCQFEKSATFNRSHFNGESWFSSVIFHGPAQFLDCEFSQWARFDDIQCKSSMQFDRSVFLETPNKSDHGFEGERGAWFTCAKFYGQAWFKHVAFNDIVSFQSVLFDNDGIFHGTAFVKKVDFNGVLSHRFFTLTGSIFKEIPVFIQTHFDEAPVFDDVQIFFKGSSKDKNQLAKWRALRRLAIQGHDHEKERDFFAEELSSVPRFKARYWMGFFYWLFSDYGRSIIRPACWWAFLSALSYMFYLGSSPNLMTKDTSQLVDMLPIGRSDIPCVDHSNTLEGQKFYFSTTATREAINLTLRTSLLDMEKRNDSDLISYGCLYGIQGSYSSSKGTEYTAIRPRAVSWYIVLQKLLSGLFIFLFGAALRNMLRVQ